MNNCVFQCSPLLGKGGTGARQQKRAEAGPHLQHWKEGQLNLGFSLISQFILINAELCEILSI